MLGALYTYGHLVAGPISVGVSLAFAIIGRRVPGLRRDLGLAVILVCAAAVTFLQFGMVQTFSVVWARLYVCGVYLVHIAMVTLIYAFYGREVLAGERRRRAKVFAVAYAVACGLMMVALISGVTDRGVRTIDVLGIHAPMIRAGLVHAAVNVSLMIGGEVFVWWLLTRPGPWRQERLILGVPIMIAPLPVIHEQLVMLGWLDAPPLGGYFLAFAALVGVWVLADHVRTLTDAPRKFAGYEVVRKLGAGGLAQVWLASRRGSGEMDGVTQLVALKRLRPELAEDPGFVKMFLEEAQLAAKLRHPNIVALLEAGSTDQGVYLAMELVEGASLARLQQHLIARGEPLAPAAVIEVGAQVSDALAYAHELAIHRDVSPQNVLVSRTGHVKLTDFGIARSLEKTSHTQTGVIKGKIRYMPPEQIRGNEYDHRVDVYALGVVMLELATGRPRFPGQTDVQVLYQILQGQDDPDLGSVPPELAAVIRHAIDRDPANRPATAAALLAELAPMRRPAEGTAVLAKLAAEAPEAVAVEETSLPFEETQVAR